MRIDRFHTFWGATQAPVAGCVGINATTTTIDRIKHSTVIRLSRRCSTRQCPLGDLFREETEWVYQRIFAEERYPLDHEVDRDSVYQRFESYDQELSVLATAAATCAYWGPKGENRGLFALENMIERLGSPPSPESRHRMGSWMAIRQRYPIAFLSYTAGITGMEVGNWDAVGAVLLDPELENLRGDVAPFRQIHPWEFGYEFSTVDGEIGI